MGLEFHNVVEVAFLCGVVGGDPTVEVAMWETEGFQEVCEGFVGSCPFPE